MEDLDFSQFEMPVDAVEEDAEEGDAAFKPAPVVVLSNPSAGARRYTLLVPVKVDGTWLRHVTLRAVLQGDIDDFGTGRIAGIRAFVCRLTGLDAAVITAMNFADSAAIHQMFGDMVPEFVLEGGQ